MLAGVLGAGVRLFQYRNKTGSRRDILDAAARLAQAVHAAGAVLIVNDHPDIALASGADGVHLGQDDLPVEEARRLCGGNLLIGISTHSREQAVAAAAGGADYLGFGPLFPTVTKDAGPAQGRERLRMVKDAVAIPVLAIGGITVENAAEAVRAGADGVAVISAILAAPDAGAAARALVARIAVVAGLTRERTRGKNVCR